MRLELSLILACLLVVGGMYAKSRWDDHGKLKAAVQQSEDLDQAVTQKLRHDAAIDAGVRRVLTKSRELETHDPTYRDYLDRPLPAATLRLYHDAAAEIDGVDGADAGADEGH